MVMDNTDSNANGDAWKKIHWNGWGDKTKKFMISPTEPNVVLHPDGRAMSKFIPFMFDRFEVLGGKLAHTPGLDLNTILERLPPAKSNEPFLMEIGGLLASNQIETDPESRLCHSSGKNYRDLWRMRNGMIERVPDLVVFPECHENVEALMRAATKHNAVLIPFGGGTNVVGAVEADPLEGRFVVSVDMRRMRKLLNFDPASHLATFEAGVLGPDLEGQLERYNCRFGHDPDSFKHSTLGGWIATRSSGSASNKYGEMEQMVVALKVATPTGTVETPIDPRAVGPSLKEVFLGSEGALGIITEAVIKVQDKPQCTYYEGFMMPSFGSALSASYDITLLDNSPAILRSYDADDTQLSMALGFDKTHTMEVVTKMIKTYLQYVRKFDFDQVAMVIVGYEGTKTTVNCQRSQVTSILKRRGGFSLGQTAGANWQERKYDLPLVRDFALENGLWADVLETTVVHSKMADCWADVKDSVHKVWKSKGLEGWIGCHSAHQYKTGACLYFTYASYQVDKDDLSTFLELKKAATEAILRHGGSLTHHHGVGYEHVPWMHRYHSKHGLEALQGIKQMLDPAHNCNPGKLLPPAEPPVQGKEGKGKRDATGPPKEPQELRFFRAGVQRQSRL